MFTRFPLITWGWFAIPEKRAFREEEITVRGRRARRDPLPGVDSRAHVPDGLPFEREGVSSRGRDLLSLLISSIGFLHGNLIPVAAGQGARSLRTPGTFQCNDRQHGEKLYRFRRIPRPKSGGVAAGGGRPTTSFAPVGYPRSRNNGGHSEVKRPTPVRNALPSRTEPRPPRRRSRSGSHGCPRIDNARANRRECLPARRWGSSSAGRAPRSQRGGRGFNPLLLHHLLLTA